MKLRSTESQSGLAYLAIGVIAALTFAAVGALETQRPLHAVMWAFAALVSYVGIFELSMLVKATARKSIGLAATAGIVICFCGLSAAIEIGRGQTVQPQSWLFWILPTAFVLYGLIEVARK